MTSDVKGRDRDEDCIRSGHSPGGLGHWESLLPDGLRIEVLSKDQGERVEQLRSADFLMGFLRSGLSAPDYQHLSKVKLLQVLSAGYDGVDLDKLREMGLLLCNNGGANSYAVAEHAILLMLAVYRRLPDLDRLVKAGQWKSSKLGQEQEHEIAGKTVGIVGLGMIGKTLARRLSGFEVNLLYCDLVRAPPEDEAKLNVKYRALKDGRIFAAGLDTFDPEPPEAKNPLFTLPNIVVTPHAAGPTWESWPKRFGYSYANIQRVARGEAPRWVVPELR